MLEKGSIAPNFCLPDTSGKEISLSEFRGKKVVLYFYPRDNTPGCTRQACAFKSSYDEYKSRDIIVIGISKDSVISHQKFIEKHQLPFILLSDVDKKVIEAYGVWIEKKLYGKIGFGISRSTFIIDEEGVILEVIKKAKPDTNAKEILDIIDSHS